MSDSDFDRETAVEPTGPGRWRARVSDGWNIAGNPNGGYLLAIVLSAMRQLGPHPDPLSVTAHFLRPGTGGVDAEVAADLVRAGRSLTTVRGSLVQDGKQRLEVLAAHGDLAVGPDHPMLSTTPPEIPPPEECVPRSAEEQGVDLALASRITTVLDPRHAQAGRAGAAEVTGWIRFADGRPPDAQSLVVFADAFPPSIFGLLGRIGWVPTIELTVHVRRRPAPGWLLGHFTTDDLQGGRMIEEGSIWDSEGQLVARSRQLALLLSGDT